MPRVEMAGKKYGKLKALESSRRNSANNLMWWFLCDCGNVAEIDGYSVRSGKTVDCPSCARNRVTLASIEHGQSQSPEFRTWTGILTRCYNPNIRHFHNYGGRGIKVCDRWKESFAAFVADMGRRPDGYSIERINNDGDYDPGNCKWASHSEQSINKRSNVHETIDGVTKTIGEWASQAGLKYTTVYRRFSVGMRGKELLQPLMREGVR